MHNSLLRVLHFKHVPTDTITAKKCFTVVQEAIEFFVTVSQFGVPQAVIGVRRMLPLIWSKEPGVRDAVVGAYRQLYLCASAESER